MRQDNTQIFDKYMFSSIGQDKSKIQKHIISKLLILLIVILTLEFFLWEENPVTHWLESISEWPHMSWALTPLGYKYTHIKR